MKSPKYSFDQQKMIRAIRYKRLISEPISTINLCKQIEIGRSTLHRLEAGHKIDMETFIKMCSYLELDPALFFIKE